MKFRILKLLAFAGTMGYALNANVQVSQLNNTITAIGPFIGCDAGSNQPLRFTTLANYPHEWRP